MDTIIREPLGTHQTPTGASGILDVIAVLRTSRSERRVGSQAWCSDTPL